MSIQVPRTHFGSVEITPQAGKGHTAADGLRIFQIDTSNPSLGPGINPVIRLSPTAAQLAAATAVLFKIATGANAACLTRSVSTGGSAVVSSNKITLNSQLFVFPAVNTGITTVHCFEKFSARAAGSAKVMFRRQGGGAVTGRFHLWVVN